ncbi:acid protease [Leucogyrophana mollusca]|uniref:Acid protease n=1 Tax=Leucogyrophana mollusca TaxID=85980 RepID=A0ACB8BCF8_9AGAM|nr:acid protease [Leucogyrophana mollusca]
MLALKFTPLSLILVLLSSTANVFSRPSSRGLKPNSISLSHKTKQPRTAAESNMLAKFRRLAVMHKYGGPMTPMSASLMIYSQNDDEGYFAPVKLGTPGKSYDVILDTGSADLWVAGQACTSAACAQLTKFNPKESDSFRDLKLPFQVSYADSNVAGDLGADTLAVGRFTIQNQTFGVASNFPNAMNDPNFATVEKPASGILGLAWKAFATSNTTPFWEYLVESKQWDMPVMSLHLARSSGNSKQNTEPGGTFTLGAYDTTLYTGDIHFNNLTVTENPKKWTLPLAHILAQGKPVSTGSETTIPAVIDSGTTYVYGPSSTIESIYNTISGSKPDPETDGYWLYPCDTRVAIEISFADGVKWPINATDFMADKDDSSTYCRGAFAAMPTGAEDPWIFGAAFMKNVYTVLRFSPPSVGFATLSEKALAGSG